MGRRTADPAARVTLTDSALALWRGTALQALVSLLRDNQLLVGAMAEPELRAVITGPAELAGLTVEPALVDVALAEVLGEPAALALLSHALRETWLRRTGDRLTVDDYRAAGGVRAAVARTADQVYQRFDQRQARIARDVFLRLAVWQDRGRIQALNDLERVAQQPCRVHDRSRRLTLNPLVARSGKTRGTAG